MERDGELIEVRPSCIVLYQMRVLVSCFLLICRCWTIVCGLVGGLVGSEKLGSSEVTRRHRDGEKRRRGDKGLCEETGKGENEEPTTGDVCISRRIHHCAGFRIAIERRSERRSMSGPGRRTGRQ